MLESAEHEICPANKSQITIIANSFLLNKVLRMKFSLLINKKMSTIVGIFIFNSRENFMLSWIEQEKSYIILGTAQYIALDKRDIM